MMVPIIRRRLAVLLERQGDAFDLAYAVLLIAQEEYPTMDPRAYLARLKDLASRASRLAGSSSPRAVIEAINHVLFDLEGLRGNSEGYYDPRNSYLNQVLDRKLGIPITLSIVYIAVGRRLGLPVVGVGLPGHFIVGVPGGEPTWIDPFNRGQLLSLEECADRVHQAYGDRLAFSPSMLASVSNRQILTRVLNNLKSIFAQAEDYGRLLAVIDRLLLINPQDVHELRDRGVVGQRLKFYGQALADLRRYLELVPSADDADQVRSTVKAIHRDLAWQN